MAGYSYSKRNFLNFLHHTLIPDLRQDGRNALADDLLKCVHMGRTGRKSVATARYFRRVARDYKTSGATAMAKDFARCARLVAPTKRK